MELNGIRLSDRDITLGLLGLGFGGHPDFLFSCYLQVLALEGLGSRSHRNLSADAMYELGLGFRVQGLGFRVGVSDGLRAAIQQIYRNRLPVMRLVIRYCWSWWSITPRPK